MIIILDKILNFIDKINDKAAQTAKWLVLILTATLFFEVLMRYALNRPTIWSYDLSYMLGGVFFTMGMGYTLQKNVHVRVDVFFNSWKKKTQKLINIIFTTFAFFPTYGFLLYKLIPHVITSWERQERATGSFWMPPIYPFKTMLLIAVILLVLQVIAIYIKDWRFVLSKDAPTEEVE